MLFTVRDHQWEANIKISKIFIKGQFLQLNEEPVREMTIGHPPQSEERTLENLSCPITPTPVT